MWWLRSDSRLWLFAFYECIPNSTPCHIWLHLGYHSPDEGHLTGMPPLPTTFQHSYWTPSRLLNSPAGVSGITIGNQILRSTLFVDDILLFSTDPTSDFSKRRKVFATFCLSSGFKINFDKSEVLALHPRLSTNWRLSSPFAVATQHITYLGIRIGRDSSYLYSLNYPTLITKIVKELEAWAALPLLLIRRCHLFKMV